MRHGHPLASFAAAGLFLCIGCSSVRQVTPASDGAPQQNDSLTPVISVTTEPRIGIPGEPLQFSLVVSSGQPAWYSWQFGDATFSNETTPTHAYAESGSYDVIVTVVISEDTLRYSTLVEVEPDWCPEVIELNAIPFGRNRSSVSDTDEAGRHAMAMLAENIDLLKTCPSLQVIVLGSASVRERMPLVLARERAEALVQFYVNAGLARNRFRAEGQPEPVEPSRRSGPMTESRITGSLR